MATKVQRNDPCPCGSGKKYKKCCLIQQEAEADKQASRETAVPRALDWLQEHHGDAIQDSLEEDFFGGLEPEQRDELDELPEDYLQMIYLNAFEWLLAEGGLQTGEGPDDYVSAMQIVLGPKGPRIEPEGRAYLELLSSTPLDLYEVVDAVPDEGLWLRSTLAEKPEKLWVQERAASHSFHAGHHFAGRVLPMEPKILSGSIYAFEGTRYLQLRGAILEGPDDTKGTPDAVWISTCVIDAWLASLIAPPPEVTDASTGEPILLVTSHYRVKDWTKLEATLADEPGVEHNNDGDWARLEPGEDDGRRVLCTISKRDDDRLELFTRTSAAAADNAAWLEEVAGGLVEHLMRDVEDPSSRKAGEIPDSGPGPRPPQELIEEFYHKTYANWADEPIPALGNKSPREAVNTEAGKRDVIELLKTYEHGEQEQAKTLHRDVCDLSFLWEEVGLTPER